MSDRYNDPWADAGNKAVGALFQNIMSKPSAMDQHRFELQNQKTMQDMELARQNADLRQKMGSASMGLTNAQAHNARMKGQAVQQEQNMMNLFTDAMAGVQPVQTEAPRVNPQMEGPMPPVSTPDMNGLANVMQQFMGQLPKDASTSVRNSLGVMNALNMNDPFDRQMALDDNISSYSDSSAGFNAEMAEPTTVGPGSHLVDPSTGESIFNAPFKQGGGSYITQPDGTVISIDGGQPPVGKTTRNKVESQQIAESKMRGLLDYTRELAQADSMNFGIPGAVKGAAQDVNVILNGLTGAMGSNSPDEAISSAQREIMNSGVDANLLSGIFDPNLSSLQTTSDLLVFQAASALAGQSGRSMSDNDVKAFKNIVGDPQSWMMNQEKFLAKLKTIENILGMNSHVSNNVLGGDVTGSPAPVPQVTPTGGGLSPEKMSRLQELRAKRDAGTLQ